jgi:hypothetical protein
MFSKTIALGACALCLAAAGVATAAPRMTDTQYVAADRCAALMSSPNLGATDSHDMDTLVKDQERGRTEIAYEAAQEAHDNAALQASKAGPYEKTKLLAERDGACRALLSFAVAGGNSKPKT